VSGQVNRTAPRQMQETMLAPLREAAQEISRRLAR
jgi:DNA-binding IclR family transcriptional regulator